MKKLVYFLLVGFLFSGCAYINQDLKVKPDTSISESDIGGGKKITLKVVDEREDQIIGKRRDGYGMNGATITTKQDMVEILSNIIVGGLARKNFSVSSEQVPTVLKIELRVLSYDTSMGLWTGGNIGKSALKVIATAENGQVYEKMYRGQREIRTAFIGSQETNSNVVNGALSDAVDNLFKDDELLRFLAGK
jgi:uncharacterized lipoprotein YajG